MSLSPSWGELTIGSNTIQSLTYNSEYISYYYTSLILADGLSQNILTFGDLGETVWTDVVSLTYYFYYKNKLKLINYLTFLFICFAFI